MFIAGIKELRADKGYDTDAIRAFLKEHGIKPVIPGKSNREKKIRHDKKAYKGRN
jgi:IS5 family transposase